MNGDGADDVTIGGVLKAWSLLSDGVGGFSPPVTNQVPPGGSEVLAHLHADGDGILDLLWTAGGSIHLYLGDGVGGFSAAQSLPSTFSDLLHPCDFDLDGVDDLVARSWPGLSVYRGNGMGALTFDHKLALADGGGLASADVDEDGVLDFLVPHFNGVATALSAGAAHAMTAALPYAVLNKEVRDLTAVDVDGDGTDELIVASSKPTLTILDHDGTAFSAPTDVPFPLSGFSIAAADWTGDGVPDLLATNNANAFLSRSTAPGAHAPGVAEPTLAGLGRPRAADFDGDGDADLCGTVNGVQVGVFLGDDQGAFAPGVPANAGGTVRDVQVDDVDLDGDLDIAASVGTSVMVFASDGVGTVAPSALALSMADPVGSVALGDLDNDGRPDVASAASFGHEVTWALNRPGGFSLAGQRTVPSDSVAITAVDLDIDGRLDICVAHSNHGIGWHRGDGAGGLLAPRYFVAEKEVYCEAIVARDLTGDARPEVVVGAQKGAVAVAVNQADGCAAGSTYGAGCPGSGGYVPELEVVGCLTEGDSITLRVRNALGGGVCLLAMGGGVTSTPVGGGCSLLVAPLLGPLIGLPLSSGGPGDGSVAIVSNLGALPAPAFAFTLQAWVPDTGSVFGYAASNGVLVSAP